MIEAGEPGKLMIKFSVQIQRLEEYRRGLLVQIFVARAWRTWSSRAGEEGIFPGRKNSPLLWLCMVLSHMDTNIPTTYLDLQSSLKTLKINPEIMFYLLIDTKMSQSEYS